MTRAASPRPRDAGCDERCRPWRHIPVIDADLNADVPTDIGRLAPRWPPFRMSRQPQSRARALRGRRPTAGGDFANTLRRTARPARSRRCEVRSSGRSASARCVSAARPTRSRAARPAAVTSMTAIRRSLPRRVPPDPAALGKRRNGIGRRRQAHAPVRGELRQRARLLAKLHQQPEVRGGRHFAAGAQLGGDRAHHQRHDFQELASRFARVCVRCH